MFGSKQGKEDRLEQEVEILIAEGEMSVAGAGVVSRLPNPSTRREC